MKQWFLNSFLGGFYLDFLLWLDGLKPTDKTKIVPGEIAQVIREYSLVGEGVKAIKHSINQSIAARTKEEYHKKLTEIEDLALKAENDPNSEKAKYITALKSGLDFSNKDIKNDTDHAKMVQQRIKDYDELHSHIERRNAIREARKQKYGK